MSPRPAFSWPRFSSAGGSSTAGSAAASSPTYAQSCWQKGRRRGGSCCLGLRKALRLPPPCLRGSPPPPPTRRCSTGWPSSAVWLGDCLRREGEGLHKGRRRCWAAAASAWRCLAWTRSCRAPSFAPSAVCRWKPCQCPKELMVCCEGAPIVTGLPTGRPLARSPSSASGWRCCRAARDTCRAWKLMWRGRRRRDTAGVAAARERSCCQPL
mmetsp:Transcript_4047/g.11423  ORF Transcript_4047/g.11423 Transcript_4047/m.11423 type:complete len:211 (-) Transcript_4047:3770-4402(-)